MNKKNTSLPARIAVFTIGIFIMAFGVALSAKCDLGITPISSPPYILSMLLPLSMGTITTMMHCVFILLQILILRKNYKIKDLLQLVIAVVYGRMMDFSTWVLTGLNPSAYPSRLLFCLLSVLIIAYGVYLTVVADVMFLAGEGLASAISKASGIEFGKTKIMVDSSLVVISAVISLAALHQIAGIREGTLIAAVGVGLAVQAYGRIFSSVRVRRPAAEAEALKAATHLIVTVAREFDPISMTIVRRLSEITGLKLYDEELIDLVAEESGLSVDYVRRSEDRFRKGLLRTLYEQSYEYHIRNAVNDQILFDAQRRVLLKLAEREDCIIIGRNANKILGRGPNFFHIYMHAKPQYRVRRTAEEFHLDEKQAEAIISQADEHRRDYYSTYIGRDWGLASDYNLCIDVTHCNVERTAEFLKTAIEDFTWKGTGEPLPEAPARTAAQ